MSTSRQTHKNQSSSSSSKPTKNSHFHRPKSKWVPRNTPAKSTPEVASCQKIDVEKITNNGLECNDDLNEKMIPSSNDFCFEKRASHVDIVTRLEELRFGQTEVELSQELLCLNDQLQQDEVTACSLFTLPLHVYVFCIYMVVTFFCD